MNRLANYSLQFAVLAIVVFGFFLYASDLSAGPCDKIVTFKVGQVDAGFNITREEAIGYTKEASELWNTGVGKEILRYDEKGKITINYIFDERQKQTMETKILAEKIRNQKEVLSEKSDQIEIQEQNFLAQKRAYESEVIAYNKRLATYNANVKQINASGGATRVQAEEINKERRYLETKGEDLDARRVTLNQVAKTLNSHVKDYNQITQSVNRVVGQINAASTEEFEEGNYKGNTITLYEYGNLTDLKRLIAHELGHALGFEHVNDSDAIMYYLNDGDEFKLTDTDLNEYRKVCEADLGQN